MTPHGSPPEISTAFPQNEQIDALLAAIGLDLSFHQQVQM
jgi:hypothetical protein